MRFFGNNTAKARITVWFTTCFSISVFFSEVEAKEASVRERFNRESYDFFFIDKELEEVGVIWQNCQKCFKKGKTQNKNKNKKMKGVTIFQKITIFK